MLIVEDRTQERKRAHRLAYADRLANGGALAALHLGEVPALLAAAPPDPRIQASERRVRDALQLLAEPVASGPVELGDAARWAVDAVPRPDGVVVEVDVDPGLRVELPLVLLRQVLVNLVWNSVRAVGERGRIELRAGRRRRTVDLEVTDDGPGLRTEADLAFQPYFTTVPGAQGLGLSVARDIVTEAGGTITLTSDDRTRVRVNLPAVATDETSTGRLLVVDSEPPVLRLLARVLRETGVEVVGAAGGQAALRQVRESGPFDAALCAVDLPDMDGADLCRRLAKAAPSLVGRICLLGGSEDALSDHGRQLRGVVRATGLVKPFDPQEVRRVVTSLMAS